MNGRVFLAAEWRHLAMINYEVDPAVLLPRVPRGTELDSWEGRTFVSLVGFRFLNTRVMGFSIPFHRNFEEINLRFYVRRKADDGWRRSVVFVKEIVPRMAIALTARWLYNENYIALPTAHVIRTTVGSGDNIESAKYSWKIEGQENSMQVVTRGPAGQLVDGSEEEFIAQHYWGYAVQRDGGTVEYSVEHPPWRRIWQCASSSFEGDPAGLYGEQFAEYLRGKPSSAFLAEGSAVLVHKGLRIA
jgi:uncharacterized protein YqjF (DUF2071 family)